MTKFVIGGKEYTVEEAKELYEELKSIFSYDKNEITIPYTHTPTILEDNILPSILPLGTFV